MQRWEQTWSTARKERREQAQTQTHAQCTVPVIDGSICRFRRYGHTTNPVCLRSRRKCCLRESKGTWIGGQLMLACYVRCVAETLNGARTVSVCSGRLNVQKKGCCERSEIDGQ